MKRIKVPLAFVVAVILVLLAGVIVVKKRRAEVLKAPVLQSYPLPVKVVPVKRGVFEVKRSYLGTVLPLVSSRLAPRVTGHIIDVGVREGDKVFKGQVLARIDDRLFVQQYQSIKAQLEGAKSALATLDAIYSRDSMLFKNKAISREQLDRSRSARDEALAKVKTLKSSLETAKLNIGYCMLRAPMDGVITRRLQDPGDLAVPGKAVLAMEAPNRGYKVVVRVPQEMVGRLKVGGKAVIYGRSLNGTESFSASISRIYPSVAVGTLAAVEIDLPTVPFGMPSGSTLKVALVTKRVHGLIVPLRAILHTSNRDLLFAVGGGDKVRVVPVVVLAEDGSHAAVSGQLSPEEGVVVGSESTLARLHDGVTVRPVFGDGL